MEKLSIGWKRSARNNTKSDECGRGNQIFQPLIHTNKHESVLSSLVSIGVETRSAPASLAVTLAALPSMSLVPLAPFIRR